MVIDDIPVDVDPDQEVADMDREKRERLNSILEAWRVRTMTFQLPGTVDIDPVWAEYDRERGALTTRDREYLGFSSEYEGQTKRDIRYRMRNRLTQLFYDSHFFNRISADDLEAVFDSIGPGSPYLALSLYRFGLTSLRVAVGQEGEFREEFYETCTESAINGVEAWVTNNVAADSISSEDGGSRTVVSASVSVDIEKRELDFEGLREKILDGDARQKEFEEYWQFGDQQRLVNEAMNRDVSKIAVMDEVGMTATYEIEELQERLEGGSEGSSTAEVYINALKWRANQSDSK